MYALNTFLRLFRFIANTIAGVGIGFVIGYVAGAGGYTPSTFLMSIGL